MKKDKRYILIISIFLVLAVFLFVGRSYWQKFFVGETVITPNRATEAAKQAIKEGITAPVSENQPAMETQAPGLETGNGTKSETSEQTKIPAKFLNKVTFLSQAPFDNWDEYHEDACEEASYIMLEYYLTGKKLNNDIGEAEIQKMIQFQMKYLGDYKDSNMQELIQIARELYGRKNLEAVYDFPKSWIKEELAKGNPIILPVAGRLLGNPYFTPPGPLYHNIVATGYDGDMIITNDPGTRRGEGYRYHLDTLYDAIHDFTGSKEDILNGRKAMIVVR